MKKFTTLFLIFAIFFSDLGFAYELSARKKEKKDIFAEDVSQKQGYVGTLPDVSERFSKYRVETAKPYFEYNNFNRDGDLKPIPRDNPAFINIIMKKEKSSQYLNDLNDIIELLDKLETLIEQKANVQVFNAKAFYIDKSVEYFRDKYQNKAESSFISFRQLMALNSQIQAVARLREESEIYSPYVTAASSGNVFSKNNIDNQLEFLLVNLRRTLISLKEVR